MRKYFFILFVLASLHSAFGQQRLQISQYMLNYYLINPATTGIYERADLKFGYRKQWVNLPGSPSGTYLTAHGKLGKAPLEGINLPNNGAEYSGHGVGINFSLDKVGPTRINSFFLSYAYHLSLSENIDLSLGVSPGVIQHKLDRDYINLPDKDLDNTINNKVNTLKPDINIGAWMFSDDFFVGLSSFQMLRNKFAYSEGKWDDVSRMRIHYNLTAGYKFEKDDFDIIPSFLVKYVKGAPAALDLNCRVTYQDMYWGGLSYRVNDAVVAMLGLYLNNTFSFSYSYDITTSHLGKYSSGSHEIMLGCRLPFKAESRPVFF
jgi:type IX secretion system PorP/SprF family membrane protein